MMGGQDGYQRDMLSQNTTSTTLMAGIRVKPTKVFSLGLNVSATDSEQALDPFDLPADDYVATHPPMSFDFSVAHTYSMIDVSRLEASADANFKFSNSMWMNLYFRYADYEDNIALFQDASGTISILGAYMGWSF